MKPEPRRAWPSIVGLGLGAALVYGIVHDQVTARVCVEYFTVGHPPLFATRSPTLLALGWGVVATWWVGLPLGITLAVAARAGPRPKRSPRSLVQPVLFLLAGTGACALAAGVVGYALASRGSIHLWDPMATLVPPERHARFLADLWAHSASYFVGGVGGILLAGRVWVTRGARLGDHPP
jgi:hypothetical protein